MPGNETDPITELITVILEVIGIFIAISFEIVLGVIMFCIAVIFEVFDD